MYYHDRLRDIHETQFNFSANGYNELGFRY